MYERRAPPPVFIAPATSGQRGIVMFISLIVMVAMSLAAIALIRSVDTSTTVIGNLAFRLASIQPGNAAVESAAAALFSDSTVLGVRIHDTTQDLASENYYATRQPGEDPRTGIPAALQTKTSATALAAVIPLDASTDNRITYIIERMCNPGTVVANLATCDMLPPKQNTGETIGDPTTKLPPLPFYRVSIRVDGPQNTTSFLQAMLR